MITTAQGSMVRRLLADGAEQQSGEASPASVVEACREQWPEQVAD